MRLPCAPVTKEFSKPTNNCFVLVLVIVLVIVIDNPHGTFEPGCSRPLRRNTRAYLGPSRTAVLLHRVHQRPVLRRVPQTRRYLSGNEYNVKVSWKIDQSITITSTITSTSTKVRGRTPSGSRLYRYKIYASASISMSISGSMSFETSTMVVAGRTSPKYSPWARPTASHCDTSVRYIRVR